MEHTAATTERKSFLLAWRERMGFSKIDACRALGCSKSAWRDWESGASNPPRYIGLACAAVALGLSAYGEPQQQFGSEEDKP